MATGQGISPSFFLAISRVIMPDMGATGLPSFQGQLELSRVRLCAVLLLSQGQDDEVAHRDA